MTDLIEGVFRLGWWIVEVAKEGASGTTSDTNDLFLFNEQMVFEQMMAMLNSMLGALNKTRILI